MSESANMLAKRPTGIAGFDEVTHGGLPRAGAVLVVGEPGAGKTILGLQILARAIERGEGGVLVSFEQSRDQLLRDAGSFNWGHLLEDTKRCEIIDARRMRESEISGGFDIDALLSTLALCAERVNASWIVLDGIDQLLRLEPDARVAVDEIARLDEWCAEHERTVLLTGKQTAGQPLQPDALEGIEYMLSTMIVLSAQSVERRLNRRFRIAKYRGTAHVTDELAMVIDDDGIHLPYGRMSTELTIDASTERVGTGIPRLDQVLGGGIYRGSTLLISGQPGTAKTTLAASFAVAACERGEKALYLSFDEPASQIVRNTASIGLELQPHIDAGRLQIRSRAAWMSLMEQHYLELDRMIESFRPDCLVIDPVSALLKAASAESAFLTTERILGKARMLGITTVLSSLSESEDPLSETTLSHTSTLADTWIVLHYHVRGGERNRSLSVVKSRGSSHSNQVREMLISSRGVELADVYRYGSEVLMGTERMQKESEEAAARRRGEQERTRRHRDLERKLQQARQRAEDSQEEVERLMAELESETEANLAAEREAEQHAEDVLRRRNPARTGGGHESGGTGPHNRGEEE